jgi:hypothetical protein
MMSLGMRTMTTSMLWMTELEICPSAQTIDRIARDLFGIPDSWIGCGRCNGQRAGVLHTDPQQTKRAIKINAKREAVVLATSKKSHLEYMKKFPKLSRA